MECVCKYLSGPALSTHTPQARPVPEKTSQITLINEKLRQGTEFRQLAHHPSRKSVKTKFRQYKQVLPGPPSQPLLQVIAKLKRLRGQQDAWGVKLDAMQAQRPEFGPQNLYNVEENSHLHKAVLSWEIEAGS